MGADYLFYVKSIATPAPAFLRHDILVLARVPCVTAIFYRYRTTKKPTILAPLLPLTFGVGYQADLSYGNKINRIKTEAENVRVIYFFFF